MATYARRCSSLDLAASPLSSAATVSHSDVRAVDLAMAFTAVQTTGELDSVPLPPARSTADALIAYPPAPPSVVQGSACSSTGTVIRTFDALDDIDGAERVSDEEEVSARHLSQKLQLPFATPPSSPPAPTRPQAPREPRGRTPPSSPLPRGTRRSLELGASFDVAASLDSVPPPPPPPTRRLRLRLGLPRVRRRARDAPLPARFAALREDASDFLEDGATSPPPSPSRTDEARAARKSSLVARLAGGALRRRRRRRAPPAPPAPIPPALPAPVVPAPSLAVSALVVRAEQSRRMQVTHATGRRSRMRWVRPGVTPDVKRAGSFVRNVSMAKDDFIDFATATAATHRSLWRVRRAPKRPVARATHRIMDRAAGD